MQLKHLENIITWNSLLFFGGYSAFDCDSGYVTLQKKNLSIKSQAFDYIDMIEAIQNIENIFFSLQRFEFFVID